MLKEKIVMSWEPIINAIKNKETTDTILKLQKTYWNSQGISRIGNHSQGKISTLIEETIGPELQPNKKVLDFACGIGRFYNSLTQYPIIYIGVDISYNYLEIAYNRYPDILVFPIDENLPFLNNFFDFALSISLHTHTTFEQDKQIIQKIKQVLKPGGIFVCSFYDASNKFEEGIKIENYIFKHNWIIKPRDLFMINFEGFNLLKETTFQEDSNSEGLQTVLVWRKEK